MTTDHAGAAALIAGAYDRAAPIARLPVPMRAGTIEDAYAIHDALVPLRGGICGWKVGQDRDDGTITCAPLWLDHLFDASAELDAAALGGTALEIEFAFRIGTDLPPRDAPYLAEEVIAAIDAFVPLVELIGGRFTNRAELSVHEQLADGFGSAVVPGQPVRDWQNLDLRGLRVELWMNHACCQSASDSHPAGEAWRLVVWLANHLRLRQAGRGGGLHKGDLITTGSLAGISPVLPGALCEARYIDAQKGIVGQLTLLLA